MKENTQQVILVPNEIMFYVVIKHTVYDPATIFLNSLTFLPGLVLVLIVSCLHIYFLECTEMQNCLWSAYASYLFAAECKMGGIMK